MSSKKVFGRRSSILQNNIFSRILIKIYAKTIRLFALDFYALFGLRPHQLSRDRNLEIIIYQDSFIRGYDNPKKKIALFSYHVHVPS